MKLKELEERKAELLEQVETENNSETRSIDKIDELLKEIDEVNASIEKEKEIEERLLKLNVEGGKPMVKETEVRNYNAEVRAAITNEKELDITNFELRGIGVGETGVDVTNTTKQIAKTTFANAIIKKVEESSDLYRHVRKENFGSALHQIPVQAEKIGKFANVKELAKYTEKEANFRPIQMAAHKYGAITVVSEECLADTGYDIMGELLSQYGEGAGLTLDNLLVKGDAANDIEGLEALIDDAGDATGDSEVVKIPRAAAVDQGVLFDKLMETYNSLPRKYAKNAVWVISPEMAGVLNTATDGVGRPLLYQDFSGVPVSGQVTPMLLGRPVVISDEVEKLTGVAANKSIAFFGDLSKTLICGIRQNFTIKTSTEYGFINDGVAIKGTLRLDCKLALTEATSVLVTEQ